ncbi:MAG: FAD-binding protein [Chloroflexi bacterium]|nr:FAD-binding protein [Chloroflexota bacterium]
MKIAVCIKQVPVISMLKFDTESRRVVREGVPNEVNPYDVLAMSLVKNLKEEMDVEAVVVTMGPPQARDALVQCLAMGADRAVHLSDRAFAGSDTLATARALSLALKREHFDLIICGLNSVDAETGQVGPEVAAMLGLPQVTGVRRIKFSDSCKTITAERLTDEGHEVVYCPLPALITVTEGIAPEVYPRRDAMEAAQSKPIETLGASDLSDDASIFGMAGSPTWVSEIYAVETPRERRVIRDTPVEEAVRQVMGYLDERGAFDDAVKEDSEAVPRGPRRDAGDAGPIWVLAEILGGEVRQVTLELLGRARQLAERLDTSVEAVLIGKGVERHIAALTAYGADCVHVADDERLERYSTETYTTVLADAIREHRPYAVLAPSTVNGRDLMARVAAALELGLTGDCIGLEIDSEKRLVQLKPAFGGNIVAPILSRTKPYMATVRPGILTPAVPDDSVEAVVRKLPLDGLAESRVRILESVADESAEGAELERARRIVAFGKGIGGPENIGVVRKLAGALDAAIGATRDVVELGWIAKQHQVGLSGKSVAPRLYVAVALRGPFNHTVGIQKAGTVVAINNNARAQIFQAADIGIVGDYAEVVPVLAEAVRGRLKRS